MPKEDNIKDNSFGILSVTLGIISILFLGFPGVLSGILSIVFGFMQDRVSKNKWSKAGKILGIIGIVLGILAIILSYYLLYSSADYSALLNGATP
jgi:uncharacterized membrane protein HdeD (DUF308 family)